MTTNNGGVSRWPECGVSKSVLNTLYTTNFNNSGTSLKQGLDILAAVEKDFECAGMCLSSKYYTFSTVSNGPPTQTCV